MNNVCDMVGQGAAYAADGACAADGMLSVVSGDADTGAQDVPLLPLKEKDVPLRTSRRQTRPMASDTDRIPADPAGCTAHATADVISAGYETMSADESAVSTESLGDSFSPANEYRDEDGYSHNPIATLPYRVIKRAFDVLFSLVVIVVGAIPISFICIAICVESKGSPLYSQERVGKRGKTIRVFKLRSMYSDADDVRKYLSSEQLLQWQTERKVDDDPRITRVGRFIRGTSIDEIPQFLNVLAGDLSVIGPRPITRDELDLHFSHEQRRELLSVRPGITGLWQVGERNGATFESGRRQEIELSYVAEAGLHMDSKIFWATFGAMFGHGRNGR